MKKRTILFMVLMLAALLAALPVAAQNTVTEFSGTETQIVQGMPTEVSFPGGNLHFRGQVDVFEDATTDPRTTGTNYITLNGNWGATGGPMWGTFHFVSDVPGGEWVGTWTGYWDWEADMWFSGQAVGHGVGTFEGMKVTYTEMTGNGATIYVEGYIMEHVD